MPFLAAVPELDDGPAPAGIVETRATGRVKWFDRKRGFGFIVPDDGGPDILVHCSVVEEIGRRDLPEQAGIDCAYVEGPRGRQAVRIGEVDLSTALDRAPATSRPRRVLRELPDDAPWHAATVKWFSRVRGYGFLEVEGIARDVFVHMETLRDAGFAGAAPGDGLRVRVEDGPKGPLALDIEAAPAP